MHLPGIFGMQTTHMVGWQIKYFKTKIIIHFDRVWWKNSVSHMVKSWAWVGTSERQLIVPSDSTKLEQHEAHIGRRWECQCCNSKYSLLWKNMAGPNLCVVGTWVKVSIGLCFLQNVTAISKCSWYSWGCCQCSRWCQYCPSQFWFRFKVQFSIYYWIFNLLRAMGVYFGKNWIFYHLNNLSQT